MTSGAEAPGQREQQVLQLGGTSCGPGRVVVAEFGPVSAWDERSVQVQSKELDHEPIRIGLGQMVGRTNRYRAVASSRSTSERWGAPGGSRRSSSVASRAASER